MHAEIANRRADFAHGTSGDLAKIHGAICLEELAIANATLGEFGRQRAYKASSYGAELQLTPQSLPSTRRWRDGDGSIA